MSVQTHISYVVTEKKFDHMVQQQITGGSMSKKSQRFWWTALLQITKFLAKKPKMLKTRLFHTFNPAAPKSYTIIVCVKMVIISPCDILSQDQTFVKQVTPGPLTTKIESVHHIIWVNVPDLKNTYQCVHGILCLKLWDLNTYKMMVSVDIMSKYSMVNNLTVIKESIINSELNPRTLDC